MNKKNTPEIEIIDLEVYKHEIEWTIRQLKASCSTSGKIPTKDPYLLEINRDNGQKRHDGIVITY